MDALHGHIHKHWRRGIVILYDITDSGGIQVLRVGSIVKIHFIIEEKVMDPWVVMKSFIIVILFLKKS